MHKCRGENGNPETENPNRATDEYPLEVIKTVVNKYGSQDKIHKLPLDFLKKLFSIVWITVYDP